MRIHLDHAALRLESQALRGLLELEIETTHDDNAFFLDSSRYSNYRKKTVSRSLT